IQSYGVFQSYYVETLGVSLSAISWVGSMQIFILFFLGTFTGHGLDAGYFRHLYAAGTFLLLLGIFMTSLATEYRQLFLSQGVCIGIANSLLFCPTLGLVSTYFNKKKSFAVGLAVVGYATGGIVLPLVVQRLLPRIGFAWTIKVVGLITVITAVTMLCSNLMFKPRLVPRKAGSIVEWAAFRELQYVLFAAVGMFLQFLGLYFAFFYISSYSRDILHPHQQTSFNNLVIMNGVGFFGRVIPNYFADHQRIGPMNLLIPMSFMAVILSLVWIRISSYGGIIGWVCFYGFFAVGIQSLFFRRPWKPDPRLE
ncbi:MFS general substrate transporter, partial [Choiromyces venosus 120613-1]